MERYLVGTKNIWYADTKKYLVASKKFGKYQKIFGTYQEIFGTMVREKPGRNRKAEKEPRSKTKQNFRAQLVNLISTHRPSSFRQSHFSSSHLGRGCYQCSFSVQFVSTSVCPGSSGGGRPLCSWCPRTGSGGRP